jgi:alpha-galactosidase
MKVAFIGAGSVVFARNLICDILSFEELRDCTISLMDIDKSRLDTIAALADKIVTDNGLPTQVEATTDRRRALDGADYVIIMIQVGGIEAFVPDIEIPRKYGVKQAVGDTLGPGGVFRALRTIPVLVDICRDMEELCPRALLLNYANPMAINCWAMNKATGITNVGLCHSVQGTAGQLAGYIGRQYEDVTYWVAGINHMAWFLKFEVDGQDAYPLLWQAMKDPEIRAKDPVRFDVMKHFGLFVTESSGHMSEYIPYIRKRDNLIARHCGPEWLGAETGFYLRICREGWQPHYQHVEKQIRGEAPIEIKRSMEYGVRIIHAMETNTPCRINGTVPNDGLIANLPCGCAVEVPCLVDRAGLHPCYMGDLPGQAAALNRGMVNVGDLAVKAALEGDARAAFHAVLLDPLTGAVLGMDETQSMVDEMFAAEMGWLTQFRR